MPIMDEVLRMSFFHSNFISLQIMLVEFLAKAQARGEEM